MKRPLIVAMGLVLLATASCSHPVDDYLARPEPAFAWEVTGEEAMGSTTVTHLKVTTQTWQGIDWEHRVALMVPQGMQHPETALMLITGGAPGPEELALLSTASLMISAPVVILGDIPNQPLFDGLTEDALISYTFAKFMETGDATWPLLYPMTKAAVKTMDAVEAYTAQQWEQPISSWVTTGASKRGWTTWFTGVTVPERLKGIVPLVYDNLNLAAQMPHQVQSWGDYSAMIHDYTEKGLPDMLGSPEGRQLAAMVDPYTLRERAKLPKLIITGTNDAYWPLDAANLYWEQLPAPKYILYVPNAGHGLNDFVRVINAEVGFFLLATGRVPLPQPQWRFEDGAELSLIVQPGENVKRVTQFTALSDDRDFRDATWESVAATERDEDYLCQLDYPEAGWAALFAEIVYDIDGREFPVSTNVRIISARQ